MFFYYNFKHVLNNNFDFNYRISDTNTTAATLDSVNCQTANFNRINFTIKHYQFYK